jgi:hypothetical protein
VITAIFGLLTPVLNFCLTLFVKNEDKKAAMQKAWLDKIRVIQTGSQDSVNISSEYDRQIKEQDKPK